MLTLSIQYKSTLTLNAGLFAVIKYFYSVVLLLLLKYMI